MTERTAAEEMNDLDRIESRLGTLCDLVAKQIMVTQDVSAKLDRIALAIMDLRVEVNDVQAAPDPAPAPPTAVPKNIRKFEGQTRFMQSDTFDVYRYGLPGNHWLVAKVRKDGVLDTMEVETPTGQTLPITPEEVEQTFGVMPFQMVAMRGGHPTDAALNPDVEVAGER